MSTHQWSRFTDEQIDYVKDLRTTGLYGYTFTDVLTTLVLEGLRKAAADGFLDVKPAVPL